MKERHRREDEPIVSTDETEEIVVLPIEDTLDLHSFQPREVKDLLNDYLEAASQKQFKEVLIIHGKGTGVLRKTVQDILRKHPLVVSLRQPDNRRGGWGATLVVLRTEFKPHKG